LSEENFRARITDFEDKKKAKVDKMRDDYKDKDIEGCTFKPEIYSVQDGYQKRNLNQFLED
jgi:hypothetical protein